MSGVCGIHRWSGGAVRSGELETMRLAVAHRGPDGIFRHEDRRVALAHLLLRVDDATPTPVKVGSVVVVMDGLPQHERQLDYLLRRNGIQKDTEGGDTPRAERLPRLVAAAYDRWGIEFPRFIGGEFSIALWDAARDRLVLARDRVGMRPLYYSVGPGVMAFASEAKAILAHPSFPPRPCLSRIEEFEMFRFRGMRPTFFDGVHRVIPGEVVWVEGGRVRKRLVDWPGRGTQWRHGSHGAYLSRFRKIFLGAVGARLPETGAAAVLLSGGLDSSSVTSAAAHLIKTGQSRASLRAVSSIIGTFPNERPFFEEVCSKWNLPCDVVDAEDVSLLPHMNALARMLESPWNEPLNANLFFGLVKTAAASGARAVLAGVFGDDLMIALGHLADDLRKRRFRHVIAESRACVSAGLATPAEILRRMLRLSLFPNSNGPVFPDGNRRELHESVFGIYNLLIMESLELGAASQGVEIRLPFLDGRLIDLVFRIPPEERVRGGVGKRLLREGLGDLLPEKISNRMDQVSYWRFWHHMMIEAGCTAGSWGDAVIQWRRTSGKTWNNVWFGNG